MTDLRILYEDNHIIVVIKPKNIPSQADSTKDKDVVNMLKKYLKEKYKKEGNVYLGLVHRLDRPVEGIMVFAKTSKAASRLSKMVQDHDFQKTYLAVVHGKTKDKEELINKISKDKYNNTYLDDNGKEAILNYERLKYDEIDNLSVLKVNLKTGRHHQIRFQLSNINHPIYGDQRYGRQDKKQIKLCAYKLKFMHPVKKDEMEFKYIPDWSILDSIKEEL